MKRFFCILFILALSLWQLDAQDYSTKSKKAITFYQEAEKALQSRSPDFKLAMDLLQKAILKDNAFLEAYLVLADIYITLNKKQEAMDSYRKAIEIDPNFFLQAMYNLADLELSTGQYESAKEHFNTFLSHKHVHKAYFSKAKLKIKKCDFAIHAMHHPVPFHPVNLGDSINSEYHEYWPSLSADESKLVFTVLLPKDDNNPQIYLNRQEDFYTSVRKEDSSWATRKPAGPSINTPDNEGAQTISPDGKLMIFTACNRPDGEGGCDLYFSWLKNEEWTTPMNIGPPINTNHKETQPTIAPDGETLYFVSNRGGGKGALDIWKTTLSEEGYWSEPANLGDSINTPGDEQSPFIHPDNKTLYFSSDYWPGMGKSDIFLSRMDTNGTWKEPVNLGYPINTHNDEIGLVVNAAGNRAYYSSDISEASGKDIYVFDLYEEARPNFVSYMKGVVFNAETRQLLSAKFEIIDLQTTKVINKAYSDEHTGEFLVCIPTDKDYALNVSKQGYLFFSENFSLKGDHDFHEPYIMDVPLKPIRKGEKIVLRNIFYETDSYELKPESKAELNKVVEFLMKNTSLVIEIGGHTDDVGSDAYNLELSGKRAKSVVDYLVLYGIPQKRITYKGYGEKEPVADNIDEQGRAQNRRTELKIIGY